MIYVCKICKSLVLVMRNLSCCHLLNIFCTWSLKCDFQMLYKWRPYCSELQDSCSTGKPRLYGLQPSWQSISCGDGFEAEALRSSINSSRTLFLVFSGLQSKEWQHVAQYCIWQHLENHEHYFSTCFCFLGVCYYILPLPI